MNDYTTTVECLGCGGQAIEVAVDSDGNISDSVWNNEHDCCAGCVCTECCNAAKIKGEITCEYCTGKIAGFEDAAGEIVRLIARVKYLERQVKYFEDEVKEDRRSYHGELHNPDCGGNTGDGWSA